MKLIIPLEPRTKKNSQRIVFNKKLGRAMLIQSQQYKDYEKECGKHLPLLEKTINYPVNVKCIFYMPTKRRVDKSNLEASIHDILVKWEILEDDNRNIIASTDGSRVFYDKANPRTEIEITPYEGEYEMWISHKKKVEDEEGY